MEPPYLYADAPVELDIWLAYTPDVVRRMRAALDHEAARRGLLLGGPPETLLVRQQSTIGGAIPAPGEGASVPEGMVDLFGRVLVRLQAPVIGRMKELRHGQQPPPLQA
jgi:hypothetical protein